VRAIVSHFPTDGLTAQTRQVADAPELLSVTGVSGGILWREEDFGLAGVGEALRIELPRGLSDPDAIRHVETILQSISCDDEISCPGSGPVAFGALPFRPDSPASLVVPATILGYRADQTWITTIGPANGSAASLATCAGRPALESPDEFRLVSAMPHKDWQVLIADAISRIRKGQLAKVVLARRVDVSANRAFVIPEVLARFAALYPSCMIFCVDGFVGASPELLIRREGRRISTQPLAGTLASSGDMAYDQSRIDRLLTSAKDRAEHQIVVDAVLNALTPLCEVIDVPRQPSVLPLRNVYHLATSITGSLIGADREDRLPASANDRCPTAIELVARLHPTPAVAGTPTAKALDHIETVERFDRGRYAGPVGWIDARGDGTWAIGLRSAEVHDNEATIWAGVGVVADSDPASELAETQLKLQAALAALVRP
jgi:menaquinone-specific isochorismate synthase